MMFNFNIIREAISNFRSYWTSEPSTDIARFRKRRALEPTHNLMDHSDVAWSPKRRHLLDHRGVIVLDGDNASSRVPYITRRSALNQNCHETIELDDDDDDIVPVKRGNETRFKVRSKQTEKKGILTQQNGSTEKYPEDDVVLVSFVKPSNSSPWLTKNGCGSNGARRNELRNQASGLKQPTLNYSVRLDDKMQYRRLLETSSGSENSFYTPTGKLLEYDTANMTRTEKILNMSRTPPCRSPRSSVLSTRDTIKKVLNKYDNESIVIKDSEDSDSDVVFVSPPSPKPDIQVEPVNSLKKVIDQSMETSPDWIENLMKSHRSAIESRQKGIDKLKEVSEVHHKINNEMHIDLLTKRVTNALRLKEVILPIKEKEELPDLTAAQLKMVQKAFKGHPDEVLVRKFNLNITRRDITTLDGLNWLNDEVINFYMNLIIERGKDKKWPKTYAFNTFFYLKLSKEGPESLRRWTKRVDLFQYDLICVPIHLGMHWCMAIVDLRNKTIKYYDSMNGINNKCLHQLRKYLEAEHLDKKKTHFDTSSFKLENVKDIPQQMNGSDCGMFSCTFAEFISRDAAITFTQEHMPYLRRKMVVEILSGELLIK